MTYSTSPTPSTRAEIRPLIKLGVPLMIGLGAALMIGLVDTLMVAPLGTVPLAAIGLTAPPIIILISALWGIITVVSVQIATDEGAEDRAAVSSHLLNGLALAVITGVLCCLIMLALFPLLIPLGQPEEVVAILWPYWVSMSLWMLPLTIFFILKALYDAVGREWTGVALSYLGVVTNIPLNYSLIYIFDLGILGAGLASLISQLIALGAALAHWRLAPSMAPFRQDATVSWSKIKAQGRESLPLAIGYAGEGGAYSMVGIMMGWLGATALAAHQIINAVGGISYVIPLGLAGAVSIRVGNAVGKDQRDRLRPILKAALGTSILWQGAVSVIFIVFGREMAAALSMDPEVVTLAALLFIAVAILQIADGVQGTALGALRGMMDNTAPTVITLIAYWPLALPAAYLFGFTLGYGAFGIWMGYTLGLVVAGILLPIRFWRMTEPGQAP